MFPTILSYSPCTELILFLKAVEENCNDTSFRKHDSELLKTVHNTVVSNSSLQFMFANAVVNKITKLKDASFCIQYFEN